MNKIIKYLSKVVADNSITNDQWKSQIGDFTPFRLPAVAGLTKQTLLFKFFP